MMEMVVVTDKFGGATVRVAAMWPFPMPSIPGALIEAFEDRSDGLPSELATLAEHLSDDEREYLFDGCGGVAEEAWEDLACDAHNAGVNGFICVAECPVFTSNGGGSASFSWGHYRAKRLFAPTADEAIALACKWADEQFAKAAAVSA